MSGEVQEGKLIAKGGEAILERVSKWLGRPSLTAEEAAVVRAAQQENPAASVGELANEVKARLEAEAPVGVTPEQPPTGAEAAAKPAGWLRNNPKKAAAGAAGLGLASYGATGGWGDSEPAPPVGPIQPTPESGATSTTVSTTEGTKQGGPTEPVLEAPEARSPVKQALDALEAPPTFEARPLVLKDRITVVGDDGKPKEVSPEEVLNTAIKETMVTTARLAQEYKTSSNVMDKRELLEGMIRGLSMIAAGAYGLKHGVDLGGAKFDATDWTAKQQLLMQQYAAQRQAAMDDLGVRKLTYDSLRDKLNSENDRIKTIWTAESQELERAAKERDDRNKNAVIKWNAGMDMAKLTEQITQHAEDLALGYKKLQVERANSQDATEIRRLTTRMTGLGDQKKTVDAFNKTMQLREHAKGDKSIYDNQLIELNSRYFQQTGQLLLPTTFEFVTKPATVFGKEIPGTGGDSVSTGEIAKASMTARRGEGGDTSAAKPPVYQNGVKYEWNPKTGKYE